MTPHPTFNEAFRFWLKLGFISFGGPAGQISIMHQELVEKRKWISNDRFMNALNYCMLLPGPEAQQLTIYIGWLLHRIPGGLAAGSLFVIPSMFILFGLTYIYAVFGEVPLIASFFHGLKACVLSIVFAAVIKIGKKSLRNTRLVAIALMSFIAIFFLKIPFPVIIISAAFIGIFGYYINPNIFSAKKTSTIHGLEDEGYVVICENDDTCHIRPTVAKSISVLIAFMVLWTLPIILINHLSSNPIYYQAALFFTKAAFMTFGGAYSVLAYIAQAGVEHFHWLSRMEMMDGLGLAETTPGPLIMVVQFVGFMAGWHSHGSGAPIFGAVAGSLLATYFTFLPCFMFIFLGSPYIEKFRDNRMLSSALSVITAAVVGVVLNLAVWFGMYVIIKTEGGADWFATTLGAVSFIALHRYKMGMIPVLGLCGISGIIYGFVQ